MLDAAAALGLSIADDAADDPSSSPRPPAAPPAAAGPQAMTKEGQIKSLRQSLSDPDQFAERCKLWSSLHQKRQETLRSHGALAVVISGIRKHARHARALQHGSRALFELIKQDGDCAIDFPEIIEAVAPALRRLASEPGPAAQAAAVEALWLLTEICTKEANAQHAVDSGLSEVLALLLRGCHAGTAAVQQVACEAVANLAFHVAEIGGPRWRVMCASGVARAVVEAMRRHAGAPEVLQCASHALACMAAGGADAVAAAGGVAAVVGAMAAFPYHERLQGLGCGVCANVADGSPELAHCVVLAGGLASTLAALKLHPASEIVARDGCLAVSNIAQAQSQRIRAGASLAEAGLDIPTAAAVVRDALRKFPAWPQLADNGCSALRWLAECAAEATDRRSVGATAARAAIEHSTDIIKRTLRVSKESSCRAGGAAADESDEENGASDPALSLSTSEHCRLALEALERANAAGRNALPFVIPTNTRLPPAPSPAPSVEGADMAARGNPPPPAAVGAPSAVAAA